MPRDRIHKLDRGVPTALVIIALLIASPALAKVKLEVEIGWENKFRAGRWSPLFVTLSDSAPRQVTLEVYSPTDRRYALNIRQSLAIGPQPVVVPIYVPLSYRLDETSVTVRDANSGRRLEHLILSDFPVYSNRGGPEAIPAQNLFILISGSSSGQSMLQSQLAHPQNVSTSYITPSRLPLTPVAYQGIDLLLLNRPELGRLNADQQSALADWVRAGGLLIIVPGVEPAPTTGPLAEILPARLGEVRQLEIDPGVIKQAGLPARFAKLTGRDLLDPAADARQTPIFPNSTAPNSGPQSIRRWVGLGQVMLLPLDVSTLLFDDSSHARQFWRTALSGLVEFPAVDNNTQSTFYGMDEDPRRAAAHRQTLDWIGDIPGAGSFGFSYVAAVLLTMMVIVGPLDWFVLKWMGKQPWTWVTISGWIGVVTLGSIYLGHVFKSGDVYFRTASVIDEAGAARVAAHDLAGLYSPQTTRYDLEFAPHGWWTTASPVNMFGGNNLLTEIDCHQDYRGSRPLPMLINVWNVRFIEGDQLAAEPAMVQAQLTLTPGQIVVGGITNRAGVTMSDIMVRTRDGVAHLDGVIEPGATLQVDAKLTADQSLTATTQSTRQEQWPRYQQNVATTRPTAQTINIVSDLRALRIDQQLADRDDVACVYATIAAPPGERIQLNGVEAAKTEHIAVIRAMVPMRPR